MSEPPNRAGKKLRETERNFIEKMEIEGHSDRAAFQEFEMQFPGFLSERIREFNEFANTSRSGINTTRDEFKKMKTQLWEKKSLISRGLNLLISWKFLNKIDKELMENYNWHTSHFRMNVPGNRRNY
jgi:hypothetical protein